MCLKSDIVSENFQIFVKIRQKYYIKFLKLFSLFNKISIIMFKY